MEQWYVPVALALVVLLVLPFQVGWFRRRRDELLANWATRNGVRLVDSELRLFFRGPFFWSSSKQQDVYRVTVEDADGTKRTGWVRLGNWWFGLLSNKIEVRWDP